MLPRTTGLVCPGFTGALPTMNPMRVEPIAGFRSDSSAFYLIQPDTTPFAYRQFRYFMNGAYTGELFLSADYKCQFRSAISDRLSAHHGNWPFCNHITGIVCHFDFAGREEKLCISGHSFFRGTEKIDYKCRQIYVDPNRRLGVECPDKPTRRVPALYSAKAPNPPRAWNSLFIQALLAEANRRPTFHSLSPGKPGIALKESCFVPVWRIASASVRMAGLHNCTRLFVAKKHHRRCRRCHRCTRRHHAVVNVLVGVFIIVIVFIIMYGGGG